jgi:hypothetical protein
LADYMVISKYSRHLPFDDDLTDLVLSIVCRKGQPENALQPSQPPQVAGNDVGYEFSDEEPEAKKTVTKTGSDHNSGEAAVWKKVQASMSRIADTVNETLVTEQAKLLGKRYRQDNEPVKPDVQPKRHKTVEQAPQQQNIMPTIEDSDDDQSIAPAPTACVVKEDDRLRVLRVGYKRLKRQGQQLENHYKSLDESTKKLAKDTEQLTKQHRDLRKDCDTEKQNHQQLVGRCGGLETQINFLEEKIEQPTVQCAALTDDVRKLEDRGAQMAAKCTAFEDENKILRAQVVSLMARVEALEQAQAISKAPAEPDRAGASAPTDGARLAEDARYVCSRQLSDHEGRPHHRAGRGPRDERRGHTAAVVPSSQWQAAGAIKYENIDNAVMNQAPRHYKRAGSRFPRVLDMPSFEPTWDPQQEVASRRGPGYSRPSHLSTDPGIVDMTGGSSRPHQYARLTAGAPTEAPSPVQMPAPAQMPTPSQTFAPAPAPAPVSTPAPTQYPLPTFIDPALTHRPERSPIAAALPFPTASLQLEPHPQPQAQPQAAAQTQPTIQAPTQNQYNNPITNPNPNYNHNPPQNPNFPPPTNTTTNPPPRSHTQEEQQPLNPFEQHIIQAHLQTLPPTHQTQLFAFLAALDKHIWTAPTAAIVAHCEARGLRFDGLGEVVAGYKREVFGMGMMVGMRGGGEGGGFTGSGSGSGSGRGDGGRMGGERGGARDAVGESRAVAVAKREGGEDAGSGRVKAE